MKSMSYGVMPTKKQWHAHWTDPEIAVLDRGYNYVLRGSDAASARVAKVPAEGTFSEKQLYGIVKKLRDAYFKKGDENAGSIASSILQTLGFEWI